MGMDIAMYFFLICILALRMDGALLTNNQFEHALYFIENYNELEISALMVVVNEKHSTDNSFLIENVLKNDNYAKHPLYISFHVTSQNSSIMIDQLADTSLSTIIILHGFESVADLLSFISNFPKITFTVHSWLFILNSTFESQPDLKNEISEVLPIFDRKSAIDIQSQFYLVANINSKYYLLEFYYKCASQPLILQKIADLDDEIDTYKDGAMIWERRKDLSYCTIKVGYFHYPPMVTNENRSTDLEYPRRVFEIGGKTMYGREVQIFSLLHGIFNFSVSWVYVTDDKFGSFVQETEDWNGIIGMVKNKKIDTSMIALSITNERRTVVDFAQPFRRYDYLLFLKKPKPALHWDTYIAVFNWDLWILWGFFTMICASFLYFFFFYLEEGEKKKNIIIGYISAISATLLASMALDTFQACKAQGKYPITKKTVLLVVCIFGMLINYSYNAILISSLMVQDFVIPIKTLNDVLNNPSYKLMVLAGTSGETFLKESKEYEWSGQLWEKVISDKGNISSLENVEQNLLSDQYNVFYYTYPDVPMMYKSYPCIITADKSTTLSEYGSYPFHQESPYVNLFNYHLLHIVEQGLETEYFDQKEENSISCNDNDESSFMSITFDGVISAFVLSAMILFIACACLLVERIYSRSYRNANVCKENVKNSSPLRSSKLKFSKDELNISTISKFYRFDKR